MIRTLFALMLVGSACAQQAGLPTQGGVFTTDASGKICAAAADNACLEGSGASADADCCAASVPACNSGWTIHTGTGGATTGYTNNNGCSTGSNYGTCCIPDALLTACQVADTTKCTSLGAGGTGTDCYCGHGDDCTCSAGNPYLTGQQWTDSATSKTYDLYVCCTGTPAGLTAAGAATTGVAWAAVLAAVVVSAGLL